MLFFCSPLRLTPYPSRFLIAYLACDWGLTPDARYEMRDTGYESGVAGQKVGTLHDRDTGCEMTSLIFPGHCRGTACCAL